MLGPLEKLWRESMVLYLRTGVTVLETAADGLKSVEALIEGRSLPPGIDSDRPLDPTTPEAMAFLAGLQGNILKGHGRDHAMHLLVCFGRPRDEAAHAAAVPRIRAWIGRMTDTRVTSAAAQWQDRARETTLTTLMLSSRGYEFLGEKRPRDGAFREGMQERGRRLGDAPVGAWEPRYQRDAAEIHALVIVAARDPETLDSIKEPIDRELAAAGGSILVDERGRQERDSSPKRRAIEHFGYADGVSQPQFVHDAAPAARHYDQRAPLNLVLEPDRHARGGFGSYLVYRKLEQNVKSFEAAVEKVARELGQEPELVGAMAIGRFKNGTPVATQAGPKPGYDPRRDEDFDYDRDPDGSKCPLHAHVRKVNPRGSLGFLVNILAREQRRRIARRGITYTDEDNGTVGLLFMCFQNDIRDQFEFIQRSWANNPEFSEQGTGLDPIVGQAGGAAGPDDSPNWPTGHGSSGRKRIRFDEHVRLLGGEYFFAPSIAGLHALAGGG